MIEKILLDEKKFLLQEFKKYKIRPKVILTPIEPREDQIKTILEETKNSKAIIYFCLDAHLYPSNKALLEQLQNFNKELSVILLRDPYDAEYIQEGVLCITDFGWRACQIRACIQKLCCG
jgi:hypothetical protein